jgi:carboxyl-terminal processing protease
VLADFRQYLDKQGVKYTDADITANLDWIKHMIRLEVITSVFGLDDGYKVELEDDPEIDKAVETLPQARALYQNVRKIIAQRITEDPGQ